MRIRTYSIAIVAVIALLSAVPAHATEKASRPGMPSPSPLAGLQIYSVDGAHSSVRFSVVWMGLSKVHGSFPDIRAALTYDSTDITRSSVSVALGSASLFTGNDHRDKDLKSADWFDVEKFPHVTFRSTSVERSGDGLVVRGTLTIRDVTRPITLEAHDVGGFSSPFGPRRAFSGTFALDRKDYGIVGPDRFNAVQSLGKKLVGDQVDVELDLQFTSQDSDQPDGPVVGSLAKRIAAAGVPALAREYRAARARAAHPDSMVVDEGALNALGYQMIRHGRADQAIDVFALEAESYPSSVFAEVGLGQAYAVAGDRKASAEHCREALKGAPNATRAIEVLRRVEAN